MCLRIEKGNVFDKNIIKIKHTRRDHQCLSYVCAAMKSFQQNDGAILDFFFPISCLQFFFAKSNNKTLIIKD